MRELTKTELTIYSGGMSGQCVAEGGLNYLITAGALAVTLGTGGLGGVAAMSGAAYSWSGWWRDCGPKHTL